MGDSPLVSVTIRTRNRARYLREAVESVMRQTFTDWELILSDDASTDETPQFCAELLKQDPRVKVFRHEPPLGAANNWRFLLSASNGKYFVSLDDDNLFLPSFLEKTVAALESTPEAAFAFTDEWRIDTQGKRDLEQTEADSQRYQRTGLAPGLHRDTVLLTLKQSPGVNAALFVRERLSAAGGFREIAGDFADFDMFVNLANQQHLGYYIPERLIEYRLHGAQDAASYLRSESKSLSSVAILESYRFQGEEERLRLAKLAIAYSALSRARMLNGDIPGARRAAYRAWRLMPRRLKSMAALSVLFLPTPLIRRIAHARYDQRQNTVSA